MTSRASMPHMITWTAKILGCTTVGSTAALALHKRPFFQR